METFLEIVKYTLPALVVFATVYYMMKQYLDQQYKLSSLEMRKEQYDKMLPIKLQAYERLALFCERISVDNLSYRLANSGTDGLALSKSMLVAIQQEWEHNLSQQIYVSDNLWDIISLAKNNNQAVIARASQEIGVEDSPAALMQKILSIKAEGKMDPIAAARQAIKEETQLLF